MQQFDGSKQLRYQVRIFLCLRAQLIAVVVLCADGVRRFIQHLYDFLKFAQRSHPTGSSIYFIIDICYDYVDILVSRGRQMRIIMLVFFVVYVIKSRPIVITQYFIGIVQ
jgi:hypothetical protein